ncbi:hypothetical protein J1614_007074 [Plenodomus biglobosus]|nr:hypothetical protein J1614_007074 [Plenodomus biglobosus]
MHGPFTLPIPALRSCRRGSEGHGSSRGKCTPDERKNSNAHSYGTTTPAPDRNFLYNKWAPMQISLL